MDFAAPLRSRARQPYTRGRLCPHISELGDWLKLRFADGAFAKSGLLNGSLEQLLALYLQQVKTTLNLPGQLFYIDLGQALDAARLDKPGLWVSRQLKIGTLTADIEIPFHAPASET
ncbi:hypothetical protein [Pseudophaeobacter sp.]|uniref:hypothetical protein n=1 Tax=Pseudophaeobacter sp. TaxID=1971739 RepID=UPI0040588B83